jgi:ATP synthase F1 complex assembly factor 1
MRNFINFQKKYYFSYPCPRKLREIVKMTLFEMETKDRIKDIWEEYHANKPKTVAYSIEAKEIERMRVK